MQTLEGSVVILLQEVTGQTFASTINTITQKSDPGSSGTIGHTNCIYPICGYKPLGPSISSDVHQIW